jgi:hypothetical protein
MPTWTFSDGTILNSGGRVTGSSEFAAELRAAVRERVGVHVFPHPSEDVPLDPGSNYLLDIFARSRARSGHVRMSTEYEADVEDAPPALVTKIREQREAMRRAPYGRVY